MSMAIKHVETVKRTFGYPIFLSPRLKTQKQVDNFLAKQQTNFYPDESLHHDKEITPEDILREKFEEADREYLEDWLENIDKEKESGKLQAYLLKKGFTNEEAKWTIEQVKDNKKRIKDWAIANKHHGGIASRFALLATVLGVLKSIGENIEGIPGYLIKFSNIVHGVLLGICGRRRYTIHARADDEKGINDFQGKHHGNIASSVFGKIACFVERYINPLVLPLLGFLSHGKRNMLAFITTMPRLLYWRVRYSAYFGQEFATLLFKAIFNYPLALAGNEKSIEILNDIRSKKILSFENFKERFNKNLGVKEGESVITRSKKLVSDILSGDIKKTTKGAKHINEAIAPFVGISNFFLFGIFTPISAVLNLTDRAPSMIVDILSALGIAKQQFLYLFRFTTPEYVDSKKLRGKHDELAREKYKLFLTGIAANIAGILLPFSKLLNDDTPLKRIIKSLSCELSNDLVGYFLSRRRELNGRKALMRFGKKD